MTSGDGSSASSGATIDFAAEPAANWQPYDPALEPAPGGTEHEITLHATEEVIEVAPGVTQMMWTFGESVPAPPLRGQVGDLFTITLVNDGTITHTTANNLQLNSSAQLQITATGYYDFQSDGSIQYAAGGPPTTTNSGLIRKSVGSGTTVEEVNRLLKQFVQMQKMLKSLGGMAGLAGGGTKGQRRAMQLLRNRG